MISISQGKIKLENKIIDLATFQVRPKITEDDLERNYDSFISHIQEIGNYFEDTSAFDRAVNDASKDKRPKLAARETKYPFMWAFRTTFMPFDFLRPSNRRLHDEYFMAAHCITAIPRKSEEGTKEGEELLDMKLREDIAEKFKQYPGYEGIIEIPNDRTSPETKSTTFHESLHYLVTRYQAEHAIHERAVEILTDKLLTHDQDAQFENRWLHYSLNDGFGHLVGGVSAIATGILIGTSISHPPLIPISFIPGRIRDYVVERHKKSKKEEILKPIEYPIFKI
ncbi:MAG: hypothetical protein ABIJ58_00595 [Nanoarchaeota archaeon]